MPLPVSATSIITYSAGGMPLCASCPASDVEIFLVRTVRLVLAQTEIVRHQDRRQHIVKVVRHATGELADQLHLLGLIHLVLERAPLGNLEQIDDRHLGVAAVVFDTGDEELDPALA